MNRRMLEFKQRRIEMARLTQEGWTLQKIADKYGVSKQAISQALQKAAINGYQITLNNRGVVKPRANYTYLTPPKSQLCNCAICNAEFIANITYRNEKPKQTCSKECYRKLRSKLADKSGIYSKSTLVDMICDNCGKHYQKPQHQVTVAILGGCEHTYCSRNCYHTSKLIKRAT